ncbi:Hypothetical protein GLP15_739 [Giardia lamblia P15]|uniref:Uncharacterized protein n=1 Tax=Giardia intestinalis (strain P15) TaxID=658858 RepID=E1F411_GIAIA|nr:Hypothetical protein GLP15_739 [Giardia lamblia P15]
MELAYFTRLCYNDREFAIEHADTFQFAVERRPSTREILSFDAQLQALPQTLTRHSENEQEPFREEIVRQSFTGSIINGATPLIYACYHGHRTIAQYLSDHTAQPCSRDSLGRTALMWACCNITTPEALDCALLLVDKEAGMTDSYGNTALMYLLENMYLRKYDKYLELFRKLIHVEAGRFNQANNTALMLLVNSDTSFDNVLSADQIRLRKHVLKEICEIEGPLVAITNTTAMAIFLHNTERISPLKHNDYLEIIDCLLPYEGLLMDVKAIDKKMFKHICKTEDGKRRIQELTTYRPFKFRTDFVCGEYGVHQLQDRLHAIALSYISTTKQRLSELYDESLGVDSILSLTLPDSSDDPILKITPECITSALLCNLDENSFDFLQNNTTVELSCFKDSLHLSDMSTIVMDDQEEPLAPSEYLSNIAQSPNKSISILLHTGDQLSSKTDTKLAALGVGDKVNTITSLSNVGSKPVATSALLQSEGGHLLETITSMAPTVSTYSQDLDKAEGLLFTTYIAKNMYHVVFYYLTSKKFLQRRALLYNTHMLPGSTSHLIQLTRNKLLMALELGHVEVLVVLLMMYYHDHVTIPFAPLLKHGAILLNQMSNIAAKHVSRGGNTDPVDRRTRLAECMDVLKALDLRIDEIFSKIQLHLGGRFVTALEIMRPSLKLHQQKGIDFGPIDIVVPEMIE